MSAGREAFGRALLNALAGRCTCGRVKNRQGKHCCRMCRDGCGSHSILCERRNS